MSILKFKNPVTGQWEKVGIPGVDITPEEIGAATQEQLNEVIESIPTKASDLNAPTVAEMNQAIAAIPTPDVSGQISQHNEDAEAHPQIREAISSAAQAAQNAQAAANEALNSTGQVSELYEHWWSVLHGQAYSYYEESKTPITERYAVHYGGGTTSYSKEISIDSGGNITLVNPTQITGSLNSYYQLKKFLQDITSAAPCYMITTTNLSGEKLFYIPAGATYEDDDDSNTQPHTFGGIYDADYGSSIYLNTLNVPAGLVASDVTTQLITVPAGETTYVHSPDRNAYPDSGTVDGLTYKYLGVPFENAKTAPSVEVGSYVGTGTYGSANPTSVTLSFVPKLFFVGGETDQVLGLVGDGTAYSQIGDYGGRYIRISSYGTTIAWYDTQSNGASDQFNTSGKTYRYIAIG